MLFRSYFFYLKEKELLYSPGSMLSQFTPLVTESLKSENEEIARMAHDTLCKWMVVSSAFFREHYAEFLGSFKHRSVAVRNNALAAFHDFVVLYNSSVDPALLLELVEDLGRNAVLAIHSLLARDVIRIRGHSLSLLRHLEDGSSKSDGNKADETKEAIRTLLHDVSGNNNTMSTIFYEAFCGDIAEDVLEYLCTLVGRGIHEALFARCLSSGAPVERVKCIYKHLEISEKFINENSYRPELRAAMAD